MINSIIEYKTHNSTIKHTIFKTQKFDKIILKETTDYINKLYTSSHTDTHIYCCIGTVLQNLLSYITTKDKQDKFIFEIDDIEYLSKVNVYLDENIIFKRSSHYL